MLAVVVLAATVAPPSASANRPPSSLSWLDADVALVARIDIQALDRVSRLAVATGGRAASVAQLVAAISRGGLGLDVTRMKSWRDSGFDTSRPILVQVAAIDLAAAGRVADGSCPCTIRDYRRAGAGISEIFRSRTDNARGNIPQS